MLKITIERIETQNAPAAIGPYSQAVAVGDLVFLSGQIPLMPRSGELVAGGIQEQTEQVLTNLAAVLTAAGSSIETVAKVEIFLKSMDDFATVNEIYESYFTGLVKPARHVVEVSRLPKDVLIEVACTAVRDR